MIFNVPSKPKYTHFLNFSVLQMDSFAMSEKYHFNLPCFLFMFIMKCLLQYLWNITTCFVIYSLPKQQVLGHLPICGLFTIVFALGTLIAMNMSFDTEFAQPVGSLS